MVALMVVVVDEGLNLCFEITWQEVVFQQDAVLQGLVPAFDLSLCLGMIARATRVLHAFALQPFGQVTRDVAGPVVTEQSRFMNDVNLIATGCLQCQIERVRYIFSSHIGAEFPRDNEATVVVQDSAEVEPAPTKHFEIGEVCLPQLIDGRGFVFELAGSLDDNERGAGDQVVRLQHAVDGSL